MNHQKKIEELIQDNDKIRKTKHEKIMGVDSNTGKEDGKLILDRIMKGELGGHEFDNNELRVTLASLVPEYKPSDDMSDILNMMDMLLQLHHHLILSYQKKSLKITSLY